MSKKALNAANLSRLGADRLAELLIEVSTGSADLKRRLRMELSHAVGPQELARDVRKRLVSIRRSKAKVGWRRRKALVKDLEVQRAMIVDKIGPEAPDEAFELLWEFLELSAPIARRVDDARGEVAAVFATARAAFADIAPATTTAPEPLAERVWQAILADTTQVFDGIIAAVAPALGPEGLSALRGLVLAEAGVPADAGPDHPALVALNRIGSVRRSTYAAERKARLIRRSLQEIALAMGDAHGYVAHLPAADLKRPEVAADAAHRLLDADDPAAALALLDEGASRGAGDAGWQEAYLAALTALGRTADAQAFRWQSFTTTLNAAHLRAHLKHLPDFEDIEAEDRAKAHALAFKDAHAALRFFLDWPDLHHAARLVETRGTALDGDRQSELEAAAEALRSRYPLAAVLLWRRMIEAILRHARSKSYGVAANLAMDCAAADTEIETYGAHESHETFLARLRRRYPRKPAFWAKLDG
jgi:hypothetical protein